MQDEEESSDDDDDDDWEDVGNWTPEELCRSTDGTIVFSDVNLRADTSPTAVLFQQVRCPALLLQWENKHDNGLNPIWRAPSCGDTSHMCLGCRLQAAAVGMTQAGILRHLVNQAVLRRGLPPLPPPATLSFAEIEEAEEEQVRAD